MKRLFSGDVNSGTAVRERRRWRDAGRRRPRAAALPARRAAAGERNARARLRRAAEGRGGHARRMPGRRLP